MAEENNSTADLEAAKLKKAREASDARNQTRVDRLSEIADNNEAMRADEMVETEDGNLKMKPSEEEEAEEASRRESEEAERALAELQAKSLQEEGIEASEEEPEEKEERKAKESDDVKVINGETHYLTVINGKERWLTLQQLRASAQKVESADEYLQAAAESVRNAARLDLSSKPKDEPSTVEKADWKKVLRSVSMGDEEAIAKFASAIEALEQAKATPSGVTPDVLQQIDERWSFRSAAAWFEDQYQDLLGDPNLKKLVYERDSELAKASPNMPYKQRLKTAGDEIRGWTQKMKGATGPKVAASEAKTDRKKTLVNVPSAAQRQAAPPDDEPEESTADVIEKMAKARGQARPIVHRPTHRV